MTERFRLDLDLPIDDKPLFTGLDALLDRFRGQGATIRSIVAVGRARAVLGPGAEQDFGSGVPTGTSRDDSDQSTLLRLSPRRADARIATPPTVQLLDCAASVDAMARQTHTLCAGDDGDDLLLLPAPALKAMLPPAAKDIPFRAVAIVAPGPAIDERAARTAQRGLFDLGLVAVGAVNVEGFEARCFLASDAVQSPNTLGTRSRRRVAISHLGRDGRFANQLFQYAYTKLYALRHDAIAATPAWQGNELFDLRDPSSVGLALRELQFAGFSDDHRRLWEEDDPPVDVDLHGHFQELPACWKPHRSLLRRLFRLGADRQAAIDAWHREVTRGGERPLVAVHVRRGDYRILQRPDMPWFQLIPEDWYLDWLRQFWPSLRDPVLFVASDEPETVRPNFAEFAPIVVDFAAPARALPDYVLDFEILRRADYLTVCNSSYSLMAAMLAPASQKCFVPFLPGEEFVPFEPWIDPNFWDRFGQPARVRSLHGGAPRLQKRTATPECRLLDTATGETIYLDVADLLEDLRAHTTVSGIQRVQCEVIAGLAHSLAPQQLRFVALNEVGGLDLVDASMLLDLLTHLRSGIVSRNDLDGKLVALRRRTIPVGLRQHDIFFSIGAFWGARGSGLLFQELKNAGVTIGICVHDILCLTDPEYFDAGEVRRFVKGFLEGLTFTDFIVTTSEYNKESLTRYMTGRKLRPVPIEVVPLAHGLSTAAPSDAPVSEAVARIAATSYVLCVGTIEIRKNPAYLLNVWKLLIRSGRSEVPFLVLVGRKGWLVKDFTEQLQACNYLDGRIVVLHGANDVELQLLYRNCLLTMFPSFAEGWGLPVGESLAHGKICLAAETGGTREIGRDLVDYLDPYSARDGLAQLTRYLDDPQLRGRRESEIAERLHPRSWAEAAHDLVEAAQSLARQAPRFAGIAAMTLPPQRFLAVSDDARLMHFDGSDGAFSAELMCVSGWRLAESWGVWANQRSAVLRFRTCLPVGTHVLLLVRLTTSPGDLRRIRLVPGSGAAVEVVIAASSDKLAVVPCAVEADNLVTVQLSRMDAGKERAGVPAWGLRGILYFEAAHRTGGARKSPARTSVAPPKDAALPRKIEEPVAPSAGIRLQSVVMGDSTRAPSLGAFLSAKDTFWQVPPAFTVRDAPIFADLADRDFFLSGIGSEHPPELGSLRESLRLIRRGDQFVSMSRFSEGSIFDRNGVWRGYGFLHGAPSDSAPWLSHDADTVSVAADALVKAPYHDHTYLIFYNGNLHNYYHWVIEGLLLLDVLTRTLGPNEDLRIALPKSMDVAAVLDHRASLAILGLDRYPIVEIAEPLIRAREAIWVDNDLVERLPAPYLRDFQRGVAARCAGRNSRRRRLLVDRRGPTRMFANLEPVQELLHDRGFETVCLEGMNIRDQVALFQSAEFVVGTHGAGLANLVFCEPGTKVIEFMPKVQARPFFWLIAQKLGLVHGLQFCAPTVMEDFQSSITIDIGKLEALYRMVDAHR